MKEAVIKVTLSEESTLSKEWNQPCSTDLPKLHEAIRLVKLSVNDYLTELVCQQKNLGSNDQMDQMEHSDVEEEIKDDDISGFIKHVNNSNDSVSPRHHEKRKSNYLNQAKKVRK